MPHGPKKSKRTKQQKRASRVMLRKKKQNEFEHLQYLKSQLDENGVPLDLLNTDEQLLNNEQKFITRLAKRLLEIDPRSLVEYNKIKSYYKKVISKKITQYYYLNKENKSWIKQFFKDTYQCLGFSNLYEYLTYELPIENIEMTDKPVLTKELSDNIIRECSRDFDFYKLDISELLNTVLLLDIQNREYCNIKQQYGGFFGTVPWIIEYIVLNIVPQLPSYGIDFAIGALIVDPLIRKVGNLKKATETAAACVGAACAAKTVVDNVTAACVGAACAAETVVSNVTAACIGAACATKTATACVGAACGFNVAARVIPACLGAACVAKTVLPSCVGAACATGLI